MNKRQAADDHNYKRWLRLNAKPKCRLLTLEQTRKKNRAKQRLINYMVIAEILK